MKIKRMTARFGVLEGQTLTLDDGLNILYAPNESGKSTWCAFLRTMLYGIDTSQRQKGSQKPDKLKYRPWSGTPMSGTMDVTTPNGPVTLSRWTERENQPMQAFSATVTGTGRPIPGLTSETVGEALTGVPREVFERSAFIRQAGLELSNAPELDRRISAIVSSGDEEVSYIETEKRLRGWLRHRRSGRHGAIPELEAEIEAAESTLEELRADARNAAELEEQLASLEDELEEAVRSMERARAEQRRQALAELAAAREATDNVRSAAQQAQSKFAEAEAKLAATPFGSVEPEKAATRAEEVRANAEKLMRRADKVPPRGLAFIPLAAAVLAFVLAFVLPWPFVCAGAGCVCLLLTTALMIRLRRLRDRKEESLNERMRILGEYGVQAPEELEDVLRLHGGLWEEKELARRRLDNAQRALDAAVAEQKQVEKRTLGDLDFTRGDSPAAQAGRRVEHIRGRIAELREERAAAAGRARATGDAMVIESTLEEQRERLAVLKQQEQALLLALETMSLADGELQQRFSPRLAKEAAALFSRLTEGRYDEVTLARDLTAKTRLSGEAVGWEADYLSAGAKDQLYLALRLAVCALALPGDDPCPVVLDDALVNFDRERLERALDLLRELAGSRQILLFTCHEREYDYFATDAAVNRCVITQQNV